MQEAPENQHSEELCKHGYRDDAAAVGVPAASEWQACIATVTPQNSAAPGAAPDGTAAEAERKAGKRRVYVSVLAQQLLRNGAAHTGSDPHAATHTASGAALNSAAALDTPHGDGQDTPARTTPGNASSQGAVVPVATPPLDTPTQPDADAREASSSANALNASSAQGNAAAGHGALQRFTADELLASIAADLAQVQEAKRKHARHASDAAAAAVQRTHPTQLPAQNTVSMQAAVQLPKNTSSSMQPGKLGDPVHNISAASPADATHPWAPVTPSPSAPLNSQASTVAVWLVSHLRPLGPKMPLQPPAELVDIVLRRAEAAAAAPTDASPSASGDPFASVLHELVRLNAPARAATSAMGQLCVAVAEQWMRRCNAKSTGRLSDNRGSQFALASVQQGALCWKILAVVATSCVLCFCLQW